MSISSVTSDAAGRVTSWAEGDYVFTVSRDSAGRPLKLTGQSPSRKLIVAEFKYAGPGGAFSGLSGDPQSAMMGALLSEASSGGNVPIYGATNNAGSVTGLKSPKGDDIASGGSGLPIGVEGDTVSVVNGQWVSVPKVNLVRDALGSLDFTPSASDKVAAGTEGQPITGNVLTDAMTITGTVKVLDYTINGTKYTAGVSSTTSPLGTFVLNQNGAWTLDPALYSSGAMPEISFTLGNGISTTTGKLNITLSHVNHAPTANADSSTSSGGAVTVMVKANDTDPDNDPLTITQVNGSAVTAGGSAVAITNGTVALNSQGTGLVVTPTNGFNGILAFTYTISDGQGGTATGSVTVTVSPAGTGGASNWITGTTTVVPFVFSSSNIPAKGGTWTDTVTGATLKRMSDVTQDFPGQAAVYNAYSRYPTENITGEYILGFVGNSTSCLVIDRSTGAVVASLAFDNSGVGSHTIGAYHEIRWHYTAAHPYRVYFVLGQQLWMIDDVRNQSTTRTLIKDFSTVIDWAGTVGATEGRIMNDQEGNSSLDSDHWAWMATYYDTTTYATKVRAFIHYQISTDTVHIMYPSGLTGFTNLPTGETALTAFRYKPNMVEMAPDASGILIHSNRAYTGNQDEYIGTVFEAPYIWPIDFNPNTMTPFRISCDSTHSGWSSVNGVWYFVFQDSRRDKWCAAPISGSPKGYGNEGQSSMTAALSPAVIDFHTDGGIYPGMHFALCTNAADGWTMVTTYSTTHESADGISNAIFMMKIKPEAQTTKWMVAPTANWLPPPPYPKEDYNEAPASLNLAGTRALVANNWDGTTPTVASGALAGEYYVDLYEVPLPNGWSAHFP